MSDRLFASGSDPVPGGRPGAGRAPYRDSASRYPSAQYESPRYDAPQYEPARYDAPRNDSARYEPAPYDTPQYDTPQYDTPQYEPPQYEPPQYEPPQYEPPQYEQAQYEQAPYDAPQHESPRYESTRYGSGQYDAPRYESPRQESPRQESAQHDPPRLPSAEAAVGVARRLQARLERHQRVLGQIHPEPPQLRELNDTVRRMRRDVESIVLLSGDDPSGHVGGPRRLSEVLDDAASAAEETWRILVRPAATATVDPAAAVELTYVLAELLDHVTAAYPDAGIDMASYVTARTGLTVEVSVNSASRYLPDGLGTRRAAVAAEAHARRSRSGLALALPTGAPPAGGTGVVATVSCPATAITIEEPAWSSVVTTDRQPVAAVAPNGRNGSSWSGNGHYGNGAGSAMARLDPPPAPEYPSPQVDELFGPMVDLRQETVDDPQGTPIFEAIASAWFLEDQAASPEPERPGAEPLDWETPSDDEWRAAAARAVQPDPLPSTPSGLPRRRPGNQLVPPPRSQTPPSNEPTERVPDRVRNRLSTYQRGLRQGRHRAPASESDRW